MYTLDLCCCTHIRVVKTTSERGMYDIFSSLLRQVLHYMLDVIKMKSLFTWSFTVYSESNQAPKFLADEVGDT